MTRQQIIEQVHGILVRHGSTPSDCPGEDCLLVRFERSSAAVMVDFHERGSQTVISLSAPVLERLSLGGGQRESVLSALNRLNGEVDFGRFWLDEDAATIYLRHDIVGGNLDAAELMAPLRAIAAVADHHDDELRAALGSGMRAADVIAVLQEHDGF